MRKQKADAAIADELKANGLVIEAGTVIDTTAVEVSSTMGVIIAEAAAKADLTHILPKFKVVHAAVNGRHKPNGHLLIVPGKANSEQAAAGNVDSSSRLLRYFGDTAVRRALKPPKAPPARKHWVKLADNERQAAANGKREINGASAEFNPRPLIREIETTDANGLPLTVVVEPAGKDKVALTLIR